MSDMYNFDNNNYNNENHDGFNHYEFDENNNTPNHKKPNAKMVKFAKKVGAIALSAVLFGGVAAGSYQGVNALFGTSTQTEAQATTSTKSSLLKTTSSGFRIGSWPSSPAAGGRDRRRVPSASHTCTVLP